MIFCGLESNPLEPSKTTSKRGSVLNSAAVADEINRCSISFHNGLVAIIYAHNVVNERLPVHVICLGSIYRVVPKKCPLFENARPQCGQAK